MRFFVRLACFANAVVWAFLVVKGSALPPEQFRWAGLALFAVSLVGAVAPGEAKRAPEGPPAATSYAHAGATGFVRPAPVAPLAQNTPKYQALLAQGKKIQAIKALRDDCPQLGLKEAKDIIESL